VEHIESQRIVGTYRLQTGRVASRNFGYYSDREFDLRPYESLRDSLVEVGRACIHRDHRSLAVLYLLWRGIAQYALQCRARHLIGCSSLTSQNPAEGVAVYQVLQEFLPEEKWRTLPRPAFEVPAEPAAGACDKVPKLLRTYLAIGAKVCGPPAIDKEFKTIDFLTLLDLETLHPRMKARFFE
jgi:putative hemolysin